VVRMMRILIADDNEFIRQGITRLLKDEPVWQICGEASNGDEALKKVRKLLPDLVLLDISMPGLSGFEIARLIREEFSEIKLLIVSNNDAAQLLPSALQAGADGCLDKACLAAELMTSIKTFFPPTELVVAGT
jgi:DNA-binding NarL/FixJ family response regulator